MSITMIVVTSDELGIDEPQAVYIFMKHKDGSISATKDGIPVEKSKLSDLLNRLGELLAAFGAAVKENLPHKPDDPKAGGTSGRKLGPGS
ncbi:hypothetical protein RBI14_15505 [Alcaligenaceae bacterium B3P038]|nr:hypothetical protein [Alcaligenaceae bacterium B3P038]